MVILWFGFHSITCLFSVEHVNYPGAFNKNFLSLDEAEKQLYGYFKRQTGQLSNEKTWT